MIILKLLWVICFGILNVQNQVPPQPAPPEQPRPPPIVRNPNAKPLPADWVKDYTTDPNRDLLGDWLLTGCWGTSCSQQTKPNRHVEYEGYDGWYNNLARPDSGAIDTVLLRRWPAAYEDGSYEPSGKDRPNPLELSDKLLAGPIGSKSKYGKNALLVFFGQQVVEEILDAQRPACPPEYFNIEIPENHRFRNETNHTVLPFLRTRYDMKTGYSPNNPRQQINEITPYLDGGLIYGTTKTWADYLRTDETDHIVDDGLLASRDGGLFPADNIDRLPMANPPPPVNHSSFIHKHEILKVSRFFKLGNPRGNENTFLLSFGILWFRWHNYIAKILKKNNPDWNGEKIYNEARKWVIATQQRIVVEEWLPSWLGDNLMPYRGYDPSIDPQIDQFFQAAAMRFGHTLVVPGVYLRDYGREGCGYKFPTWPKNAVRTCNSYWRPQDAILTKVKENEFMDIDRLLMGMAVQLCEEEDHKIVEDLRGNVFGPLEFSRRDLMAVNIQRARDHGLPDFNTARRAFGLPPITNIDTHFNHVSQEIREELKKLHHNKLNIIDPWIGGILETKDGGPGELFKTVIRDQFRRIRDGDRFWFENKANELFTDEEIYRIKNVNVYDIIMAVTKMDHNDIPKNPFRSVPSGNSGALDIHANCIPQLNKTDDWYHLPQLNAERLHENCTKAGTYDYFSNSEVSYVLSFTFLAAFIAGSIGFVFLITFLQSKKSIEENSKVEKAVRETFKREKRVNMPYLVKEWVGPKLPLTQIVVVLDSQMKQIQVNTQKGILLRAIDFSKSNKLQIYLIHDKLHLLLRTPNEYDMVLKFDSDYLRENFLLALEKFTDESHIDRERINWALKPMYKQAVTRMARQKQLDTFFRVVFAQAFHIQHTDDEILRVDSKSAKEIIYTELTINEFAEALAMKAESEFVRRIFSLIDKDRNGFVSFREFLDLLFVFAKGSPQEKAKLLFDMYDINGTGYLTETDFKNMIKSLMETCHATVQQDDLDQTIYTIKKDVRLSNQNGMNFDDFYKLFRDEIEKVGNVNIEFSNASRQHIDNSYLDDAQDTIESLYQDPSELQNRIGGQLRTNRDTQIIDDEQERTMKKPSFNKSCIYALSRYIESNVRELFWLSLFTLVLISIFAERAYYYSVEREHSGLRRIAGYGVTITRGAASAQMFTYSVLLLTMCRNTISLLRDTFLNNYIPFDRSVEMHKYVACWALLFTVMHIIGHAFNFYHISTQTADDLTCLFRNYFHATHELPKFHYWCWQTMTGITGVILTLIGSVIYVCAIPGISRNLFWFGHGLYRLFYIFLVLHGTGRLIQEPYFPYFFIGPLFLYIIDAVVSASRKKIEIRVLQAELLPSGVTKLEFKRPNNFEYKSGQWIRLACLGLNPSEFHPFTLSSSPDEMNLTVHIRAVGPWTTSIRSLYDSNLLMDNPLPKIHLDGPYGEGHQDWYRYDVSVLIGGGIGVTPFASILKDIVFRANKAHKANCKKVYFIWVTKTQRQFEWLVDIIRELETVDAIQIVSTHLFITQFYHKFDLRTTLLYICERHFQRVSGKSLFTGLKAVTHFGRPQFAQFFTSIQSLHPKVSNIGVFSCGPPPMTASVDKACFNVNKLSYSAATFHHHYKNF